MTEVTTASPTNDSQVKHDGAAYLLLLLGLISLVPYVFAWYLQDLREHTTQFLWGYLFAFAVYSLAVLLVLRMGNISRWTLVGIFAIAALMQIILLFTPPTLSDDMYRYIWDGRVQANGINPYRYPPIDLNLADLRDEIIFPQINRLTAVTIYPPGAQLAFAALWRLRPDQVRWFQISVAVGGLLGGALLAGLLKDLGRPTARIAIYLWSPLLAFETAHAAHVDGIMLPLLIGAWWARIRQRDALVGILLALATGIKLYPAFLFPALWRPNHPSGRWRMPLAFGLTLVTLYLPYLLTDGTRVLGYLPSYFQETFNISPLVEFVFLLSRWLSIPPLQGTSLINLAMLLALGGWMVWRPVNDGEMAIRRSIWIIGAITLFSYNLFSWYLLWLLPLAAIFLAPNIPKDLAIRPSRLSRFYLPRADAWTGWWLFCGLIGLSYTFFINWKTIQVAIWAQYLPLYLFLTIDLIHKLWNDRIIPPQTNYA